MDMAYTIEETLAGTDVDTALANAPYLIYSEVLEGARRPLAFLQVALEDFSLIGVTGDTIQFIKSTQLSATSSNEAAVLAGMASADKTLSAVTVSATNTVWAATQLSDYLREDFPKINWVRLHLRNMGKAVMEYLDADVYTVLAAASGMVTHSCTTLDYDEIVDALAKMENNNWIADERNPPYLIVAPESASGMLKDTDFMDTRRYTTYELSRLVQGEIGLYGGCRVLKTSHLDGKVNAYIVFPSNTELGPVVVIAWKRRIKVVNEYEASKGYTYFNTSIRAKPVVVQVLGMCEITLSTTP